MEKKEKDILVQTLKHTINISITKELKREKSVQGHQRQGIKGIFGSS